LNQWIRLHIGIINGQGIKMYKGELASNGKMFMKTHKLVIKGEEPKHKCGYHYTIKITFLIK